MHGWKDMPVIHTNSSLRQYWNSLSLNDLYNSYEPRTQHNQNIHSLECWNKIQKRNLNFLTLSGLTKSKAFCRTNPPSKDRLIVLIYHPLLCNSIQHNQAFLSLKILYHFFKGIWIKYTFVRKKNCESNVSNIVIGNGG